MGSQIEMEHRKGEEEGTKQIDYVLELTLGLRMRTRLCPSIQFY